MFYIIIRSVSTVLVTMTKAVGVNQPSMTVWLCSIHMNSNEHISSMTVAFLWMAMNASMTVWLCSIPMNGMETSHLWQYDCSIHMNGNEHIKWLIDCCLTSRYNIIMIIISPMAIWMIFSLLRRFILSSITDKTFT